MNGMVAPIVAAEIVETPDFLRPRRTISVVMVVYRTGQALEESVERVLRDPLVDELVIVDNGATSAEARCLSRVADRDERVIVLTGHGNIGFARGANLGASRATGDILVFLNPDAFLQAGCLVELVRELERRSEPCIVGGRVLNADRTEQRGGRRGDLTPISALLSLSGLAKTVPAWRRYQVHWEREPLPEGVAPAPVISGACFCMRREDFDALDGFDERYFMHVEDVDLCWRVRKIGGVVLFNPKAEVVHLGQTSQASALKVELHKGMSLVRYFRKRAEGPGQSVLAWALAPLIIGAAVARPIMRGLARGGAKRPMLLENLRLG